MSIDAFRIVRALGRLNDLQAKRACGWVLGLTESERELAIEQARTGIPHSILVHHDELVGRGVRSLAEVKRGACGACGKRLPACHGDAGEPWGGLDVCDRCGVFLVRPAPETGRAGKGDVRR